MDEYLVIDGNNLLHALRESGAVPALGRETLVRQLERWAKTAAAKVTLVFDGAPPAGAMARQLSSRILSVRFSAPRTADDLIVEFVRRASDPAMVRVISDDGAIRHEVGLRRCQHVGTGPFIQELFSPPSPPQRSTAPPPEKPSAPTADELEKWKQKFGSENDEPFDGYEAMIH